MEIEIESKRNNLLLKRTEIYFTVKHEGESTPNREIVRSELADKLNAKKENIIVNKLEGSFGRSVTSGYAKVYSSVKETKKAEKEYILKRNKISADDKKKDEKKENKAEDAIKKLVEETKAEEPSKEEAAQVEEKPAELKEEASSDESEDKKE